MSAEDHKQALPTSFRLGPYRVVRVLGVGGFGVTYLCEHTGLGVQVAVKEYLPNEIAVRDGTEVHPKSAGDREGFEWGLSRFSDEARTLARFEHPNVVRVRDCFEANNTAYIVMDYEDGEPLDVLLRRHGTLTESQLKRVLLPVADGLRLVHAEGFLHRDIKPSNVFVRRSDESPVLLDFGSARQALGQKSRSMTAIASAGYSPPEQYEGNGPQGAWTDIYALSALCYRAITGDAPLDATQRQNQLLRTQTDPLPSLAETPAADYSPAFLQAVDWGLRLIETERPQSLDEWLPRFERTTAPQLSCDLESRQANQSASPTVRRTGKRKADGEGNRAVWITVGLGSLLVIGLGLAGLTTQQDADQAAISVRKAAEQGDAVAQFNLGNLYRRGEGVPEDAGQAAVWYHKAAEQGHADAQALLSHLYFQGNGVLKDVGQAVIWLRKAAEQGHARAQGTLGAVYREGESVPKDAGEAAAWFRKAAQQGDAFAQTGLGNLYLQGDGVPKDASLAAVWFRKAAEQGDALSQFNLGIRYSQGDGAPKDAGQAIVWFRKAAEQGLAVAQFNLGVRYAEGNGLPKDAVQAAIWYRKAAEQGLAVAQFNLGNLYRRGEGVLEDAGEAAIWYRKAANQGHSGAQYHLGVRYYQGDDVPKDAGQAATWFRKAAEQGHVTAQYILGLLYGEGEGVPLDLVQSYAWLNLAAAGGNSYALRGRTDLQKHMTRSQIANAQRLSRELANP